MESSAHPLNCKNIFLIYHLPKKNKKNYPKHEGATYSQRNKKPQNTKKLWRFTPCFNTLKIRLFLPVIISMYISYPLHNHRQHHTETHTHKITHTHTQRTHIHKLKQNHYLRFVNPVLGNKFVQNLVGEGEDNGLEIMIFPILTLGLEKTFPQIILIFKMGSFVIGGVEHINNCPLDLIPLDYWNVSKVVAILENIYFYVVKSLQ